MQLDLFHALNEPSNANYLPFDKLFEEMLQL